MVAHVEVLLLGPVDMRGGRNDSRMATDRRDEYL